MKNNRPNPAVCLALAALMLPGCVGYQIGSSLPPDMRTIFIPTFMNESGEPLLEIEATNATIAEFQREGTLRISGEDAADLVLECRLTGINLDPLRYDRADRSRPNEYRMTLDAFMVLRRADTRRVLSRRQVKGETTFIFTGNLAASKKSAIPEASRDLGKRIVESVVEAWW